MIPISASHPFSESDWDTDKFLPRRNERWQLQSPSALGQPPSRPSPTATPSLISAHVPAPPPSYSPSSRVLWYIPPFGIHTAGPASKGFQREDGEGRRTKWLLAWQCDRGRRVWELPKQRLVPSFMNTLQLVHFNPVNRAANLAEETHLKTCKSAQ